MVRAFGKISENSKFERSSLSSSQEESSSKVKDWNNDDDKKTSFRSQPWEYRKDLANKSALKVYGYKNKNQ